MWARKRRDRWRCLLAKVPVLLATCAGLWLLFAVALFVKLGERAETAELSRMERWRLAANASLSLLASPFVLATEAIEGDAAAARVAQAEQLGLRTLRLEVAPQHMAALDQKRQQAIRDGILCTDPDDFVPGWAHFGGTAIPIEMRLKGDWIDHLTANSWSLRVKTRGDTHLFGMRKLSLHAVSCRGGPGELLLLDEMRDAGVLAPRSFPVYVRCNQRDFGVMLVEEHFATELIEAGRRRPGVIVAFDESVFWRQRREFRRRIGMTGQNIARYEGTYFDKASSMALRVFDEKRVWRSDLLRPQAEAAIGLLRGFLAGHLEARDVFDLPLWARHRCLCSIWGSTHGLVSHNLRIYFNPITRLLEPIAFDNSTEPANLDAPAVWQRIELFAGFAVPEFRAECRRFATNYAAELASDRGQALRRESADLSATLHQLNDPQPAFDTTALLQRCRQLLAAALPEAEPRDHARAIEGKFSPEENPIALLKAYWSAHDGAGVLELVNPLQGDVIVDAVRWRRGKHAVTLASTASPILRGTPTRQASTRIAVPWSPQHAGSLEIECHTPDAVARRVLQVAHRSGPARTESWFDNQFGNRFGNRTPRECADAHASVDLHDGTLVIRAGDASFDHDLITPPGIAVRIEAGAQLAFAADARLIIRGPLQIAGTREQPVRLRSIDSSWLGLVVLGEDTPVAIDWLVVTDTAPHANDVWGLTGSVTLHRCTAKVMHSHFAGTQCEDALNIVDSQFELHHCRFTEVSSDAFDGDFCSGRLANCQFESIGGDGIDVSGSQVVVTASALRDVRDKAISVGEQSTCTADGLVIHGAGVAMAVKDGSNATLRDSSVAEVRLAALMAFVKKPVFGCARLRAINITVASDVVVALAQHGSTITVDDEVVPTAAIDVDQLYQTAMRKSR